MCDRFVLRKEPGRAWNGLVGWNEKTGPCAGQGPVFGEMAFRVRLVGADEGGELAVAVEEGRLFVLVEIAHEVNETAGDVFAHAVDEVDAFAGDLNHDLPAVFGGVESLDVAQLFQPIHEAGGRRSAMPHFFGNVGHREVVLVGEVAKEEKLGEGDVPFVQFLGQVQQERALGEHDEVRQSSGILADERVFFFYSLHKWYGGWC